MYTKAIRKIYQNLKYGHLDKLFPLAEAAGFSATTHNGDIWVKVKDGEWVKSPFEISDFSDNE